MKYALHILMLCLFTTSPGHCAESAKIWHVAEQQFITEKTLMQRLGQAKNILLGVRRDNPHHHTAAAGIIESLVKKDRKPTILMGNVERSKQNAFAIFTNRHKDPAKIYDASGLDMLLDWTHNGEPDWAILRPPFDMAMLKKIPMKAARFSRYEIGQLHQNGPGGLPDDVKTDLLPLLSRPLKNRIRTQIAQDIRQNYCGILPPEVMAKFVMLHRAQNGLYAREMARVTAGIALLITAQKYALKNSGARPMLEQFAGPGRTISLSFVESGQDKPGPDVDYIWYTPKINRPSICPNQSTN